MAASRLKWYVIGIVGLLGAAALWAGTAGTPAFLDATGRLRPALTSTPLVLAPDTDQHIQLTTIGAGQVIVNGTTLPYTPTLQNACDNDTSDCNLTGLTATRKLILEGDTVGGARFEMYESAGNMFFVCLQDDDSACNHVFELATSRKFAVGSASIPDGLNIIEAEPQTIDLIERSGDPTTAASTRWKLYFKSTGLFLKDDAGAVIGPLDVTASSTTTLTNKTLDAEGTGNVLTIPRRVWLPFAGCNNATAGPVWDLPTSSPAVAACVTGTNTQKGVLDFADGSNLSAQYTYLLPSTWSGNIDVKLKWFSTTTSGDVVWQVQSACVADAETDDPSWDTDILAITDTTKGTTLQTNDASGVLSTSTHLSGCAAGELLHLKLFRDSAHASDTMAGTARAIGIELVMRETL